MDATQAASLNEDWIRVARWNVTDAKGDPVVDLDTLAKVLDTDRAGAAQELLASPSSAAAPPELIAEAQAEAAGGDLTDPFAEPAGGEPVGTGVDGKAFIKKPLYREVEHPRDRLGHWVDKGGTVSIRGGGTGEVLDAAVGHGRIRVRRDSDGREVVLDAGLVTQIRTPEQNGVGLVEIADDDPRALPGMSDAEFAARAEAVDRIGKAASKAGLSTDALYSLNGKGKVWAPERAALHKQIVDEVWATAGNVPNEGRALFSGGLGGAGKSSTLRNPLAGVDQKNYLTVNPDDVKEIMAARGMVPQLPPEIDDVGLSPMEKVALIHEESSHIANLIAARAYAERKNIIWDLTMASTKSINDRIALMKAADYTEVKALFVDIPVEGSVSRAMKRYRDGQDNFARGTGFGGRFVPAYIIRKNANETFSSNNRATFQELRDQFDDWTLWDNSVDGRVPRLVTRKGADNIAESDRAAADGLTDVDRINAQYATTTTTANGTAVALDQPGTAAVLAKTLRQYGVRPSRVATTGGSRR
jgi:hypothetical protein